MIQLNKSMLLLLLRAAHAQPGDASLKINVTVEKNSFVCLYITDFLLGGWVSSAFSLATVKLIQLEETFSMKCV